MKKIKLILVFLTVFIGTAIGQQTQLDFTMQLQNTNNHDAVIYPNPIKGLRFKVQSHSTIEKIVITDMLGNIILTKHIREYANNDILINMPSCNKGLYMVKITFDDNKEIIKKLVYQ